MFSLSQRKKRSYIYFAHITNNRLICIDIYFDSTCTDAPNMHRTNAQRRDRRQWLCFPINTPRNPTQPTNTLHTAIAQCIRQPNHFVYRSGTIRLLSSICCLLSVVVIFIACFSKLIHIIFACCITT